MDRYNAVAVLYEMAKAYQDLMVRSGYSKDEQEEQALAHIKELLEKMEKGDGS